MDNPSARPSCSATVSRIKELIEQHLPDEVEVTQLIGGDTGAMGLQSVADELTNVSQSGSGTAFDQAMARAGRKTGRSGR